MKIFSSFILAMAVVFLAGASSPDKLPDEFIKALDTATESVLYSLDPVLTVTDKDKSLYEWKLLGQTAVGRELTARFAEAIKTGIVEAPKIPRRCSFSPRHNLRVIARGRTYDFLICFQCGDMEIYRDAGLKRKLHIAADSQIFNRFLKLAKVPVAKVQ